MSSQSGERWAVVTLKNLATGQRFFQKNQILAIFANGEHKYPVKIHLELEGKEVITRTLFFGINKFPILDIYTKH